MVMFSEIPTGREEPRDLSSEISTRLADALIAVTHDGRILFWNEGASVIFGYSRQEALDRLFVDLVVPEAQHATIGAQLGATLRTGVIHYETERRRRNGQIIYVDSAMQLLRESGAGCEVIVLSERDLSLIHISEPT